MQNQSISLDMSAITLSGLCLVHCLLLPVVVGSLPALSVFSEAEWVHKLFVIFAVPVSVLAFTRYPGLSRKTMWPAMFALVGLFCLLGAAFIEALHEHEVALTTIGATMLAAAHIWRWRKHRTKT